MVRFDRALSNECLEYFKSKLGFLFKEPIVVGSRNYDIQIREEDQCTIYYGTTKVLDIRYRKSRRWCDLFAEKTYKEQPCFIKMEEIFNKPDVNLEGLQQATRDYLEKVEVRNSFTFEGGIQDRVMLRYGRNGGTGDEIILIDREAVLGFTNTTEREKFYGAVEKTHKTIRDLSGFKGKGHLPREMDAIGINRKTGALCLVEIKHSQAQSSELMGAPWQLLFYILAWKKAITEEREGIVRGANALISCKKSLGLLTTDVRCFSSNDIPINSYLLLNKQVQSEDVRDRFFASVQAVNGYLKNNNIGPILVVDEELKSTA